MSCEDVINLGIIYLNKKLLIVLGGPLEEMWSKHDWWKWAMIPIIWIEIIFGATG